MLYPDWTMTLRLSAYRIPWGSTVSTAFPSVISGSVGTEKNVSQMRAGRPAEFCGDFPDKLHHWLWPKLWLHSNFWVPTSHPSWIAVSFSSSNRATKGMGSSRGLRRFRKMRNENILSSRFWVRPRRSSWRTGPSGRHPGSSNGPKIFFLTIKYFEYYNCH